MKSLVFDDDGLLFSAFTTAGTFRAGGLGGLPLLLPSEALGARPASFPAFLSLRGPRPPDIDIGTPRHPMTSGWTSTPLRDGCRTGLGLAVMSSKTGN
jgi:hypothetical protein